MSLSNTLLLVTLPSGNLAVYEVSPQHLNLQSYGQDLDEIARMCGTQVAHEKDGVWYQRGAWQPINDARVLAAISKLACSPSAEQQRQDLAKAARILLGTQLFNDLFRR